MTAAIELLGHRRMLSLVTVDEMGDTSVAGHDTLRDGIAKADIDSPGDVADLYIINEEARHVFAEIQVEQIDRILRLHSF